MTGLLIALAAVVILATLGGIFAFPAAAAITCPACYGLERFEVNIFVERRMPSQGRIHVVEALTAARKRVLDCYGNFNSNPRILICATESLWLS